MSTREEVIRLTGDSADAVKAIDETTEATKKLEAETKAAEKAAKKAARDIKKALKEQQKATEDAAKAAEKAAAEQKKNFRDAALGAGAIAAALGVAAQKYMEVDAAAGRLANANKAAGASASDVAAQQTVAREALRKYGITTLESTNALQKLTDASGDAAKAAKDYKLAIDIAAQANISLEQATEMLAKARNGEVEELKSLRDINKEQATDLGKIEDGALRAELAIRLLTAAYDGSAEANAGAIDKSAAFKAQLEELQVVTGKLVVSTGEATEGVLRFVGLLSEKQSLVESWAETAGVLSKAMDGIANFDGGQFLSTLAERQADTAAFAMNPLTALPTLAGNAIFALQDVAETANAVAKSSKAAAAEVDKLAKKPIGSGGETASEVNAVIAGELAKQEAVKKTESVKKTVRKREVVAEKEVQEDILTDWKRWRAEQDKLEAEADERAFREKIARMKLQGDIRGALEAELAESDATEGEKELALREFDTRAREDANARALAQKEEENRLSDESIAKLEEQIALSIEYANAIGGTGKAIAGAFLGGDEAKRASAAIDGAIATYQAAMAFWTGNIPAAIGLTTAAASAFAVAGSGGGASKKAGGGGGAVAPSATVDRMMGSEAGRSESHERAPTNTTLVLNLSTVNTVTPETADAIVGGVNRAMISTVGGRK